MNLEAPIVGSGESLVCMSTQYEYFMKPWLICMSTIYGTFTRLP